MQSVQDPKKPELLAPVGGWSQLQTAIRFGADAVYLATDKFGMRQRAQNFTLDTVGEAIAYAHERGVKVHITLNTVMNDRDMEELPAYCEALERAGADAFIVSDLGAFMVAKRHAPTVQLHVSTQASVTNAEAARAWYELGASRIVCAREMSLEDIAYLRAHTPLELEIEAFVHGAMCVAVSGRCLISAVMTGRSGNRGYCSQSCRWNYALMEEKRPGQYYPIEEDVRGSYLMNAKDMNMLAHLDELAAAGVTSFKIEGRNKRAMYVASVVHAYRQVIDGVPADQVEDELYAISHRPYGTGFYFGEPDQTPESDGYVKDCLHVATVTSCVPEDAAGQGTDASCDSPMRYRVRVTCHNRFREGECLELLAPLRPIDHCKVRELAWIPLSDAGTALPPEKVEVANRAMDAYEFVSDIEMAEGDFLRFRLEDDSAARGALSGMSLSSKDS